MIDKVRLCGRYFYHNDIIYLGSAGAFIEFCGEISSLSIDFSPLDIIPGFECYFNVYINDMKSPVIKIKADGEKIVDLTSFLIGQVQPVKVRILKITEAQYCACGISGINFDGVIRPTKALEKNILVIGHSLVAGYGITGSKAAFTTRDEDFSLSYSYLLGQTLGADITALCYSGDGIISRWMAPEDAGPVTYDLIPDIYPYREYYLGKALYDKDNPLFDNLTYRPDMILINVGANDYSFTGQVKERLRLYVEKYTEFVKSVAADFPGVPIRLLDGFTEESMCEQAIEVADACKKLNLDTVFIPIPKQDKEANGVGSADHPNVISHRLAAESLIESIKK